MPALRRTLSSKYKLRLDHTGDHYFVIVHQCEQIMEIAYGRLNIAPIPRHGMYSRVKRAFRSRIRKLELCNRESLPGTTISCRDKIWRLSRQPMKQSSAQESNPPPPISHLYKQPTKLERLICGQLVVALLGGWSPCHIRRRSYTIERLETVTLNAAERVAGEILVL
ncbi:hypothetical protein BCR39DRAFT_368788 [Naematelia encephala]|uniref:Uncharacterized protein n=1 Tax=Naematelia encephala TaxID=71784 RepID=A0A1Y2AKZ4_9TREE|nr:hypothetical protein BCR39DRAFT_368788 [Naematelia encephala]